MSSSELSSGEGTTAARRRGSARPQWSCAARSDAEPGGRGPASCKHVRSPEARQIECKTAARAAQGAGRTGAPHAATRRAPRCRPQQEGPHRTSGRRRSRLSFPHGALRVGNVPAPWLFVLVSLAMPPRFVPLPQRAASELDGAHIARLGRPRVPSSNAVGFAAEGCLAPFVGPCSRATTFSHLTFARSRRHHVREGRCHRW